MRLMALSVVVLAGAVVTAAATVAGNGDMMKVGMGMLVVTGGLFVIEWWPMPREVKGAARVEKS
jgi:hypothetical protein